LRPGRAYTNTDRDSYGNGDRDSYGCTKVYSNTKAAPDATAAPVARSAIWNVKAATRETSREFSQAVKGGTRDRELA